MIPGVVLNDPGGQFKIRARRIQNIQNPSFSALSALVLLCSLLSLLSALVLLCSLLSLLSALLSLGPPGARRPDSPNGARWSSNGAPMEPKWSSKGAQAQMEPNGAQMEPGGAQMELQRGSSPNGAQWSSSGARLSSNGAQRSPMKLKWGRGVGGGLRGSWNKYKMYNNK